MTPNEETPGETNVMLHYARSISTLVLLAAVASPAMAEDASGSRAGQSVAQADPTLRALKESAESDEVNILQSRLDAALEEIEKLKAGGRSTILPVPPSLASKSDGDDPLRSAYPISKKAGVRLAQVHFDTNSVELSPGGRRLTEEAAAWIKTVPGRRIIVAGFSDSVGPADVNKRISQGRAQSVAAVLEDLDIDPSQIEIMALGEGMGPERTADGVAEPLNRCVAIFVAHEES